MPHTDSANQAQRAQIEDWLRDAKGGCADARARLLEACRQFLTETAQRAVSHPLRVKCAPSDLVQETALDALRDFDQFQGARQEEFFAWLRKILLDNAATARRRYEHTRKRQLSREVSLDAASGVRRGLYDNQLSPRSALARVEKLREVEHAVARLSDDYRTVLLLRSRDHLSFVEIGVQIERSAEACRKLWFRAVEQLRRELVSQNGKH